MKRKVREPKIPDPERDPSGYCLHYNGRLVVREIKVATMTRYVLIDTKHDKKELTSRSNTTRDAAWREWAREIKKAVEAFRKPKVFSNQLAGRTSNYAPRSGGMVRTDFLNAPGDTRRERKQALRDALKQRNVTRNFVEAQEEKKNV